MTRVAPILLLSILSLQAQQTPTAIVNVTVVPMDHDGIAEHQTVVVQGGRIKMVGPSRSLHLPTGSQQIDGRGKFLMPGLADMHVHFVREALPQNASFSTPSPSGRTPGIPASASSDHEHENTAYALMFLANGITTVRNMSGERDDRCLCQRNRFGSHPGATCLFDRADHRRQSAGLAKRSDRGNLCPGRASCSIRQGTWLRRDQSLQSPFAGGIRRHRGGGTA